MTRQKQIDKICKWMGWVKKWRVPDGWIVGKGDYCFPSDVPRLDKESNIVAPGTFDPFTNPSDCARVMDEVYERQLVSISKTWAESSIVEFRSADIASNRVGYARAKTESEAKMNALLEAIGKE